MTTKKGKTFLYLIYNIVRLGKMVGKIHEDKLNMNLQSNIQKI